MLEDYKADIQKLNSSNPLALNDADALIRTLVAYVRSRKGREAIALSRPALC
jgi:hypothetical protein